MVDFLIVIFGFLVQYPYVLSVLFLGRFVLNDVAQISPFSVETHVLCSFHL